MARFFASWVCSGLVLVKLGCSHVCMNEQEIPTDILLLFQSGKCSISSQRVVGLSGSHE